MNPHHDSDTTSDKLQHAKEEAAVKDKRIKTEDVTKTRGQSFEDFNLDHNL